MATLRCFGKVQVAKKVVVDSGDITFLSWIFLFHSTLNFHWELFVVSEKFWKQNLFLDARWDFTFFRRIILVSHYRKISIGTIWCFKIFLVAKIEWTREDVITFIRRSFIGSQYGRIHWEPSGTSENILAAKTFFGCKGGGGHHVLPSRLFCLTLPKNFNGNSWVLQKFPGSKNFVWMREQDITFSAEKFL